MLEKLTKLSAPYVSSLSIDGMKGRKMIFPNRAKELDRDILFVYGIHGNMERFYGIVHFLARFGTVTMPDLPGFGGMDTFYQIGKKPTIDNYADYLATFIKEHYSDRKITIAALSYGFIVTTRMLQRHPDLQGQVELLISVVGIADGDDFGVSKTTRRKILFALWLMQHQPWRWIMYKATSNIWILNTFFYKDTHPKIKGMKPEDKPGFVAFEAHLWKINELKTYGAAMTEMFRFHHPNIKLPMHVHHIGTKQDHWLNDEQVREHLKSIYGSMTYHESASTNHGGTAYDSEDEAEIIVPPSIVALLSRTK